jgi:hypothetical protein
MTEKEDHMNDSGKKEIQKNLSGKDEMNLVDFPFATIHPKDKRKVIVYEGWMTENNKRQQVKWTVEGGALTGLPNEFGVRIFLALLLLADEQGWPEQVTFTIYRILQILGLPDTKQYYEATKAELAKLAKLTISSEGAFWDNERKKRVTIRQFHLVDDLRLVYSTDGQSYDEEDGTNYVTFGKQVLRSVQAGYIKRLDFTFYRQLDKPLSRQLYRFLDRRMRYRNRFEIDIFDLANRLGMAVYKYPSDIAKVLQPAMDELVDASYLSEESGVVKVGKYTRIRFIKASVQEIEAGEDVTEESATEYEDDWGDSWSELRRLYQTGDNEARLEAAFHASLRYTINEATYAAYMAEIVVLSYKDQKVVLGAANSYSRDFLQGRLLNKLQSWFSDQVDETVTVTFEIPPQYQHDEQG